MTTPATAPARVLGRYALHGEIASGGMATVHLGRLLATAGFARTVAIKRLHPHYAKDPDFVSMFLDEARLAARIRHPNVTATLDIVALEGELFLVMDYIEGETLSRLLRSARATGENTPTAIAAAIVIGVLHGLHAAHEATSERGDPLEIVHRDVSPQNVIVGTDGVARVVDFGIAKASSRVQTTRDGVLKGKLAYMAPEQLSGQVTRATDIYTASIVLWEMLAGRLLYQGMDDGVVYARIVAGEIERPSKYAPDLPRELETITMRGLAREPSERFATAREMARALERASPQAPASEIGEWVERLAKATLIRRAHLVAAIERDAATWDLDALSDATTRVKGSAASPRAPEEPSLERAHDLVTGSTGSITRADVMERRVHVGWYALTVALLLAGVGLFVAFSRGRDASHAEDAAAAPAESVATAVTTPSAAARTEPSVSADVTPASAAPSLPSAPVPLTASVATPRPRPTGAPRSAASGTNCTPPYTLDAVGDRIYKRECLR